MLKYEIYVDQYDGVLFRDNNIKVLKINEVFYWEKRVALVSSVWWYVLCSRLKFKHRHYKYVQYGY